MKKVTKKKNLESLTKQELIKEIKRLKRQISTLKSKSKVHNSGVHENGQPFHIGGW